MAWTAADVVRLPPRVEARAAGKGGQFAKGVPAGAGDKLVAAAIDSNTADGFRTIHDVALGYDDPGRSRPLNPFAPMAPELRSRIFREYRVAGKGGQFAKGGGRVPGSGSLDSGRGDAVAAIMSGASGGGGSTPISKELSDELVARQGLIAIGGMPTGYKPTKLGGVQEVSPTPGGNPLSKPWVADVVAGNPKLAAQYDSQKLKATNQQVRGSAKEQVVTALSKRMIDDPEFHDAVDRSLGEKLPPVNKTVGTTYKGDAYVSYNLEGVALGHPGANGANTPFAVKVLARSARTPEAKKSLGEAWEAVRNKHGDDATVGHLTEELKSRGVPVRTAIARGLTQYHLDTWASTAGDSHPGAIAAQLSAGIHHGATISPLKRHTRAVATMQEAQRLMVERDPLHRAYLRAEYEHTQDYLARRGITEVVLRRGHAPSAGELLLKTAKVGQTVRVESNPLTSWSTSRAVANRFKHGGRRLSMRVPAALIQSTSVTGRGCLNEWEVLVLGSPLSEATVED